MNRTGFKRENRSGFSTFYLWGYALSLALALLALPAAAQSFDFGDAPASYGSPGHQIPASPLYFLGNPVDSATAQLDAETAPAFSANADGDDTSGADDEAAVTLITEVGRVTARVDVAYLTPSNPGGITLCGWVDGAVTGAVNGVFDAAEGQCVEVTDALCLPSPTNFANRCILSFDIGGLPADAVSYARFRVSKDTLLTTAAGGTGLAADGEVEDYRIQTLNADAGDAPGDNINPITVDGVDRKYDQAIHLLSPDDYFLGTVRPDADTLDFRNVDADGDDTTGTDDEDGVILAVNPSAGTVTATVTVTNQTTRTIQLSAWVDGFQGIDGQFGSVGELKQAKIPPPGGAYTALPPPRGRGTACSETATAGVWTCTIIWDAGDNLVLHPSGVTYARFRVAEESTDDSSTGTKDKGEVEDYRIDFTGSQIFDYGDAPQSYGDAFHIIAANAPYLGANAPDPEAASQYSAGADGDDTTGADDEDGITPGSFTADPAKPGFLFLRPQAIVTVPVYDAQNPPTLCGWLDADLDGDFNTIGILTATEGVCFKVETGAGKPCTQSGNAFTCSFASTPLRVLNSARTTYARFRVSTGVLSIADDTGGQVDGEVEDYLLATPLGSLTIIKDALYGDATFDFASQALGAFSLTTVGGTAQRTFDLLATGTYDLSEAVPSGWRLDGATCSDGSNPASVNLAAGEDVTCTFRNAKRDSIVVVKRAAGGDATFDFVSQSLGNFSLTTVNGLAQRSFDNLADGVYDLSEIVPAGWSLTAATCSDGSPVNRIALDPGETVICTFDNARQDTIIVEKRAVGGDDRFSFTGSPAIGAFALNTSNGIASQAFGGLAAGTYAIAETVPAGWRQTGATCDNGNSPSNIQLAPGQTVKCTFDNEKQDTITVVKRAVGGDDTFPFVSNTLGNFNLKTVKGEAQRSFGNLAPGIYDLSETVPAGWTLSGTPTCSDGSPVNRIDLSPGETVVCVFLNLKQDTIVVEKRTQGGDGAFPFTATGPAATPVAPFTLTTANGVASQSLTGLAAGTYNLAETVPAGWRQTAATCDNGNSPSSVQLAPGQTVKCTFDNEKQDTITVVKRAVGGDATFPFVSQTLGNFNLKTVKGEAQRSFGNLAPGTYNIAETVPAGWRQTAATCDNGNSPSSVQLAPGQTVRCTFENEKQDTITVIKRAVGGDGTFPFASQTLGNFSLTTVNGEAQRSFGNLAPGTYDLSETVPAGWNLSAATCSDGSSPASIRLSPGVAVTCTFTNLKQNSIVIEQRTQGGDGAFAFTSPQLGAFSLTTSGGTASRAFAGLQAGAYAISQTTPAGWTLVGATCDNGDPPDRINLGSGQSVKCTFVSQFQSVPPSDIPTLSQWGLLLLAALLALGAWRYGPMRAECR